MKKTIFIIAASIVVLAQSPAVSAQSKGPPAEAKIDFRWDVKIPMRDGINLSANLYIPEGLAKPGPCVFSLNPYINQGAHFRGVYFAPRGVTYASVDSRGRGNSDGEFRPFIQESQDGYDIVEWLAKQPFCNGKVSMWGGSYLGYAQWATAKGRPPHLASIMPIASGYPGLDFPQRYNIQSAYPLQWLLYTAGNTGQDTMFGDYKFWGAKYREWHEKGLAFKDLDRAMKMPSPVFQEWAAHPYLDAYWDAYVPSASDYAQLKLPILTVTGSHDGDQPGALTYYRNHMRNASPEERARHYLIIGPWDHAATVAPRRDIGGIKFGPDSLLDMPRLAVDWWMWTAADGPKPEFLKNRVAYYVMGAEKWRYADTLEAVTAESMPLYLDSLRNPTDVFVAGSLNGDGPGKGKADHYAFDPRQPSSTDADLGSFGGLTQQRTVFANPNQLIYHSEPFEKPTELSGFFKLSAWIAIDRPDTDFSATIYEIDQDGTSILLTSERLRARYRDSLREPKLVNTTKAIRYDFTRFDFVSRQIKKGSRLRLVIGPINSSQSVKNYNTGGVIAEDTIADAQTVKVALYHDRSHPSALYIPLAHPESPTELKAPPSAFIPSQ